MPLKPGAHLGPYEVLSLLGAGGMGEVYRARDARLAREVAIKVLPEDSTADPERLRRFEQEAKAVGEMTEPTKADAPKLDPGLVDASSRPVG